jgi:cysteinyl-tRNA synthetase
VTSRCGRARKDGEDTLWDSPWGSPWGEGRPGWHIEWRRPIEFSDDTMAQAVARGQTFRNAFTLSAAPADESQWAELAAVLDDDFDTPRALAIMHRWASERQLGLLSQALEIFGLASPAAPMRRPVCPR